MWPFSVLGIAPTRDTRAIKSAYSALLKRTRPEDDPDGYQQLSVAFDHALRYARDGSEPTPIQMFDVDDAEPSSTSMATDPAPNDRKTAAEWLRNFQVRIDKPDARVSLGVWRDLLGRPELDGFDVREQLADPVFETLSKWLREEMAWGFNSSVARACAERFDWYERQLRLDALFDADTANRVWKALESARPPTPSKVTTGWRFWWWRIPVWLFTGLLLTGVINASLRALFGPDQLSHSQIEAALRDKRFEQVKKELGSRLTLNGNEHWQYALALAATGDLLGARNHMDEAIRNVPKVSGPFVFRARLHERLGDFDAQRDDLMSAVTLAPEDGNVLNELAWLLATSADDAVRDGQRAVALAEQADRLLESREAIVVDTLAAAYAATDRFDEAVATQRRAIKLLTDSTAETLGEEFDDRLQLYTSGRAYRAD